MCDDTCFTSGLFIHLKKYQDREQIVVNFKSVLSDESCTFDAQILDCGRKGTVARDFRPLVFSMNRTHIVPKFIP